MGIHLSYKDGDFYDTEFWCALFGFIALVIAHFIDYPMRMLGYERCCNITNLLERFDPTSLVASMTSGHDNHRAFDPRFLHLHLTKFVLHTAGLALMAVASGSMAEHVFANEPAGSAGMKESQLKAWASVPFVVIWLCTVVPKIWGEGYGNGHRAIVPHSIAISAIAVCWVLLGQFAARNKVDETIRYFAWAGSGGLAFAECLMHAKYLDGHVYSALRNFGGALYVAAGSLFFLALTHKINLTH